MKNILVPTDFSAEANNALKAAVDMSKTIDGKVILLNVVDHPDTAELSTQGQSSSGMDSIFTFKLLEKMKNDLSDQAEQYPDASIEIEMALGDLHKKINEKVAENKIDLVIMGTKGAEGMQEVMIGSNAEKVVRLAHCPVLTIKESSVDTQPDKMMFASDFTENMDNVANRLKEFQEHYNAELHLVFINTPSKFEMSTESNARMKKFISKYKLNNTHFHVFNHRDEEDGILSFAEENGMDLVCVATHSRTGLAHLLSGSISEGVVNHSKKPVLSFSLKHLK